MQGDGLMDIALLSMSLSQMKVAQEAGISVMKMAMETDKGQAAKVTQIIESTKQIERSLNPHLGGNIDIKL